MGIMGKSTISMAIFDSYFKLPEGMSQIIVSDGCGVVISDVGAVRERRCAPLCGQLKASLTQAPKNCRNSDGDKISYSMHISLSNLAATGSMFVFRA